MSVGWLARPHVGIEVLVTAWACDAEDELQRFAGPCRCTSARPTGQVALRKSRSSTLPTPILTMIEQLDTSSSPS